MRIEWVDAVGNLTHNTLTRNNNNNPTHNIYPYIIQNWFMLFLFKLTLPKVT